MGNRIRNRRWSKRPTYIYGISVCNDDGSFKDYRTRNISLEGLLVKPMIEDVERGSLLEIILPIRMSGQTKRHRVPVTVVHTSEDGTGLMFMRYDRELFGLITEITYGNIKQD